MRSFLKKILLTTLAIVLLCGLIGCNETKSGEMLRFSAYGDGYAVSINPEYAAEVTLIDIPESYNGKPVVRISEYGFSNCGALVNLTLPTGLREIGSAAFSNCSSLKKLELPDTVTLIDSYAFSDCTALEIVTLGDGVSQLGSHAFAFCDQLKELTLSSSMTTIDEYTFYNCRSLKNVEFPDSVTTIREYAFQKCSTLSKVSIGAGLSDLDLEAFDGCVAISEMTVQPDNETFSAKDGVLYTKNTKEILYVPPMLSGDVTIMDGVKSIPTNSFAEIETLVTVTIPASVQSIGVCAFMDCTNLTDIFFVDSNAVWADKDDEMILTFNDSIRAAEALKDENAHALKVWKKQSTLQTSSSMLVFSEVDGGYEVSIDTSSKKNAKQIEIPDTYSGKPVLQIADYGFSGCQALEEILLPTSLKQIGKAAFSDCTSLITISIPASVESIDVHAFMDCSALTNIVFLDAETSWKNEDLGVLDVSDSARAAEMIKDAEKSWVKQSA